jgi:predicted Rossmann fold flavoprotein
MIDEKQYDVVILGGGAAGMMAAIWAGRQGARVLVIEYNDTLGKKILSTGNGRCNYSHRNLELTDYRSNTGDVSFFETAFSLVSAEDTRKFFHSIGLFDRAKGDLLYPRSMQAASVLEVLRQQIFLEKIPVLYHTKVKAPVQTPEGFLLTLPQNRSIYAGRLIIACGGAASAVSGSTDDGFYYAKSLGHTIEPVVPALTFLTLRGNPLAALSGVRCDGVIRLYEGDQCRGTERGELQMASYGLSGIPVFQLSRYASYGLLHQQPLRVELDVMPDYSNEEIIDYIESFASHTERDAELSACLIGMLHPKLVSWLLDITGISPKQRIADCTGEQLRELAERIKNSRYEVIGTGDKKSAQITAGGVSLREIDPLTMESVLVPGLYFAGEVMDVDGICGGYNLQWAWTSGCIAGINAGKEK